MKRSIIWGFVGFFVLVILFVVSAVVWIYPRLSAVDSPNIRAARLALNHTALSRVTDVKWFTGGALSQTVYGVDAQGRPLDVFVYGNATIPVYAHSLITPKRAVQALFALGIHPLTVLTDALGYCRVSPYQQQTNAIYFVSAKTPAGRYVFAYVNAYSGSLLWHETATVNHPYLD
ncbi:DUF5590 domain-containing protein [Ferroacidibacillus organovorans]|uniref:Cell wall elongation regulator TseB-like domain-containing protein n=1 Tax=Ferroacidibacillus organovorans TaxID=1765683 RepID=A0A1V4EV40_9BACL|nr:DUF5590 domain-containing protein [Ferroacidibacillus organovorans]OPG16518.1 hypothetical protein B2M26_06500 [Ferroacidibacillus organovorans]